MAGVRTVSEFSPTVPWMTPAKESPLISKVMMIGVPKFAPPTATAVLPACGPDPGDSEKITGLR